VLIIADSGANPVHVAADMLAQAEHDPMAAAILLTTDMDLAMQVVVEVKQMMINHSRKMLVEKAIANFGLIVVVDSLKSAAELSNVFAPEHLELEVAVRAYPPRGGDFPRQFHTGGGGGLFGRTESYAADFGFGAVCVAVGGGDVYEALQSDSVFR
jgi:Histidinol dehydrogenase